MNQRRFFLALGTGLLTTGLFLLIMVSGLGLFFMFLSILPVLMAGLGYSSTRAFDASMIAAILLGIFTGWEVGVVFVIFFGLPAWYISQQTMRFTRDENGTLIWRPMGLVMVDMVLYSCLIMGAITLHYALNANGMDVVMQEKVHKALAELPAEYGHVIERFSSDWSFLVFSMLSWVWAIGFYAHTWLAGRLLAKQKRLHRQSMAVEIFAMPGWMLYLLAVAALASLIGSPSMQFLGKASFITLLLPYFFLGLALVHESTSQWAGRGLLLFFIYLMLLSQIWVALVIAASGLYYHVKHLNKRLPPGTKSPK